MAASPIYRQCLGCVGRPVGIRTKDGRMHRGVVTRVSNSHVFLRPLEGRNLGGFGYGFGGYGGYGGYGGWGWGAGWGIALATIAALSPLFFW
ncbi:hypothetical protein ACW2QC_19300 [Virgibacillus sp. FSP13]